MKLAIPSPTYPAVTKPFGPSILTNFSYGAKVDWTIGIAPENAEIKEIIEETFKSKLLELVNYNLTYFSNGSALEAYELENANLDYGLVFDHWTDELNYTIRAKGVPKAQDMTNDGLGCHPTDDRIAEMQENNIRGLIHCAPTNYYYEGFLNLQSAIEYSWIKVRLFFPLRNSMKKKFCWCFSCNPLRILDTPKFH